MHSIGIITGPPNEPVLFCTLSSVGVCNAAGVRAGRPPGAWERGVETLPAVGPAGQPNGTWTVDTPVTGRIGGPAADTARQASTVTSC